MYICMCIYVYIYIYVCMHHELCRFCLEKITDRYRQAMTGITPDAHTKINGPRGNGFSWFLMVSHPSTIVPMN